MTKEMKEAQTIIDSLPTRKEEKIIEETKENMEKEKTMKLSVQEGAAASVMNGLGDSYITPYALALNANNAQIGLLGSFAGILGPLSQIGGSRLMEKYPRKKIFSIAVTFQAFMWIPILLLPLIMHADSLSPILLIVFYSMYAIAGSIGGPAWFSMLGDIVPERIRGKYFGKRNTVSGTVALTTTLGAAFLLDFFKTKGILLICFSILFAVAAIARFVSALLLRKHYDPKIELHDGYYFSFFQFLKKAPKNNFGRFVIYTFLINLSVNIAGPFFTVYMLKDLNFSYITFTLVNISASLASLLVMQIWGKFSDKYGNLRMLKICSFLLPIIPFAWIVSPSPIYLILVPQLISGIGWAGFNLAASNFIYDTVTTQRRGICVTYFNLTNGIGVFIGAALGGFLAHYLQIQFMNILLFIFVISGFARLLSAMIMLPMIKEVKIVKKFKFVLPVFSYKFFHVFRGTVFEILNGSFLKGRRKKKT